MTTAEGGMKDPKIEDRRLASYLYGIRAVWFGWDKVKIWVHKDVSVWMQLFLYMISKT